MPGPNRMMPGGKKGARILTEDYLCRCVNLKMIHNISSLPVIIFQ